MEKYQEKCIFLFSFKTKNNVGIDTKHSGSKNIRQVRRLILSD